MGFLKVVGDEDSAFSGSHSATFQSPAHLMAQHFQVTPVEGANFTVFIYNAMGKEL